MKLSNPQSMACAAGAITLYGIAVVGGYRLVSFLDGTFGWSTPGAALAGGDDLKTEEPVYISDEKQPVAEVAELKRDEDPQVSAAPAPTIETEAPIVASEERFVPPAASEPENPSPLPEYREPIRDSPPEHLSAAAFQTGLGGGPDLIPNFENSAPLLASATARPNGNRPVAAGNREPSVPAAESPAESPAPARSLSVNAKVSLETPVAKAAVDLKVGNPSSVSVDLADLPVLEDVAVAVDTSSLGLGQPDAAPVELASSNRRSQTTTVRNSRAGSNPHYLRALGGSVSGLIGGVGTPPAGSGVEYRPHSTDTRLQVPGLVSVNLPSSNLHNASSRGSADRVSPVNTAVPQAIRSVAIPNVRPAAITAPVKNLLPQVGINTSGPGINVGLGGLNIRVNTGLLR